MSVQEHVERSLRVGQRSFVIRIIRMINGCFISVSEGENHRIGSLNVSLHSTPGVNTAKVIPSKYDSVFLSMVSERVAAITNGICITSLYSKEALDLDTMKTIMGTITEALSDQHGST